MGRQYFMVFMVLLFAVALTGSVSAVDTNCEVGIRVNYEYADDNGNINPDIQELTDGNGTKVNFTTTFDPAANMTKIKFNYENITENTVFTVKIRAPGYRELSHTFKLTSYGTGYAAHLSLQMNATDAYKRGREITKKADQLLNFTKTGEVLVITTAGSAYYKNQTTEDVLEGILNQGRGIISYGKGNLLMLRKTRLDPLDFAFIVRKGNDLILAYFKNASMTPLYVGTVSQNMTLTQYQTLQKKLGDDTFPIASLANAWAIGLSPDILREAAFHGHVCMGTICGYAMIETLLKYYPATNEFGLPLEGVSYQVIGVPGGSDDDVFIYAMDATPGKRAYVGFNTTEDTNIVGFIRWNSKTKTGTLIIMAYNLQELIKKYKQETCETAVSELKFNAWAVKKLKTNPESLVDILYAFDNLTEEQVHYLMGYEPNKGNTTVAAAGLDLNYILNQTNLINATPSSRTYSTGTLTYDDLRNIGRLAAEKAIELFRAIGITLERDDYQLFVLTSAGYVRLKGQDTSPVWDGIYDVLGSRLSRKTLLPVHAPLWGNLKFDFCLVNGTQKIIKSIYYNVTSGTFTVQNSASYIIEEVLPYDPPFDVLMGWLFHNHVCGGSSPGYLIADYIFNNYPKGENEKYIYVTTLDNCKDDILFMLFGVSAGQGTYANQRLTSEETTLETTGGGMNGMVGYIIVWDEKTNTGRVAIITWQSPRFAPGSNSYEEYIRLYKHDYSSPNLVSLPTVSTAAERLINREELGILLAGGTGSMNALQYIFSIPANRTLADLVQVDNGGSHDGNQGGVPGGVPGGSTGGVPSGSSHGATGGHAGYSPGEDISATPASVSAASEVSEESSVEGKRVYEVKNATSPGSDSGSSAWYIYGIVGVLAAAGLVAFGFLRGGAGK
ncbi:FmdE family protein [Methanothermobacter wolfeii]|uniref:FmdE family protein n=1 Tax=Methanothermobacter wolfeii TaxID=145261 RepID=UPI0024B3C885|nr:FmdE family protein [Methanothermobacter wolfeii]MDI6702413.1 FmdE family protein [Methanothermobacter wolfeii]MDI6841952.1 FmdE family protein [Methanothermobacter wolfeii]